VAGKILTGVSAVLGGVIGAIVGGVVGVEVIERKNAWPGARPDAAARAASTGSVIGLLVGTFTGAALAANSAPAYYVPPPVGAAGLPKGLGAAQEPHKCTAKSATAIAQQLPGAPWAYAGSLNRGCPLPMQVTERHYDVTTPVGRKNIPAFYGNDGRLVLRCPTTGEQFVFTRAS